MRSSFRESHFQIWKHRIEQHVGWDLEDLPDETYRIWFENTNLTPKDVAHIIFNNNSLY